VRRRNLECPRATRAAKSAAHDDDAGSCPLREGWAWKKAR
jgi:hypothetical protein